MDKLFQTDDCIPNEKTVQHHVMVMLNSAIKISPRIDTLLTKIDDLENSFDCFLTIQDIIDIYENELERLKSIAEQLKPAAHAELENRKALYRKQK